MIDRAHELPITKQAKALSISRGSVYYLPRPVSEADLAIMRRLDRLHLEFPFAGSRMLKGLLAAEGCKIGRRHVKTLMQRMGIEALYRRPRTTKPEPGQAERVSAVDLDGRVRAVGEIVADNDGPHCLRRRRPRNDWPSNPRLGHRSSGRRPEQRRHAEVGREEISGRLLSANNEISADSVGSRRQSAARPRYSDAFIIGPPPT
jgi:hypothetical protein